MLQVPCCPALAGQHRLSACSSSKPPGRRRVHRAGRTPAAATPAAAAKQGQPARNAAPCKPPAPLPTPSADGGAAAAATAAAAAISVSLKQLQHTASSLDAEPTLDGLLTAFQQLSLIQKQLQGECRQCKVILFRQQRKDRKRAGAAAAAAAATEQAQVQLAALNQLRAAADDAQDFLLSLVQQLLQDQPPSACSQLLTSAAFRQLNAECVNRLAVNTFVDKQAEASPQDMAGLMAALALVRCCSGGSSNQVAGFERNQLSSLFTGIMSHLLAHISDTIQHQQQQQQQQQESAAAPAGRQSTRSSGTRHTSRTSPAEPGAAAAAVAVDVQAYCQQVAAALAAHVSARVPISSSLVPHVLHVLGPQAPKWLHTLSDVESAPSISHLAGLITHPSRYDYTYLAAALERLSLLAEQQQQQQDKQEEQDASSMQHAAEARQLQQRRLTRLLLGRLRQLQTDATAAELSAVLTAASKLGVQDARFIGSATALAVTPAYLAAASDGYMANVMWTVAALSSSSSSGGGRTDQDAGFSLRQQQAVLRQCLEKLVQLIKQQQQQSQRRSGLAAAAAAGVGSDVQPSNVIMALWAAASAGAAAPQKLQLSAVFEYLAQPAVLQQLTGPNSSSSSSSSVSSPDEAVRTCGTVIWAAAQLGFTGDLCMLKPYVSAFLQATQAAPVACSSSLTIVLSLASLIHQQQEQQQQGADSPGADDVQYWQACLLQASRAVVVSLQQQQGQQLQGHAAAVVSQLLWAHDVVGLSPPQEQLDALLELTGDQAPQRLLQLISQQYLSAAASLPDLLTHLQSPTAAAGLSDIVTAAAAFTRLVELQQQQQRQQQQQQQQGGQQNTAADSSIKALTKQSCSIIAQHLTPALQSQLAAAAAAAAAEAAATEPAAAAAAAVVEASAAARETAAAVATVIRVTSQLGYRDNILAAACLEAFAAHMGSASVADAAAVVAALSEAGRAVGKIYTSSSTLHHIVSACTKVLSPHLQAALGSTGEALATGTAAADEQVASLAGHSPVLLGQKLLQLHAAAGLQPPAETTYELLLVVGDEAGLDVLRPNEAAASVIASLAAVADLSQLPAWQGISIGSSSSSFATDLQSSRRAAARGVAGSSHPNPQQQGQQLQFPWAWQSQQEQLLQELWQQLLLGSLLPRLNDTTPKQLATALEAVAVLAGRGGQQQQQQQQQPSAAAAATAAAGEGAAAAAGPAAAQVALDIGLAKDFARAVLDAVAPQGFAAAVPPADGSSSSSFLAGWRPGEWKGEHVAAVAAAATQLDVSCQTFFAAVETDLLAGTQTAGGMPQAALSEEQQQQQRKKPRVVNVRLQHVISICCAAAALDCRVDRLLTHAVGEALTAAAEQQQQQQEALAASQSVGKQGAGRQKKRQQQRSDLGVEPELLLLLSWAVAVADLPQLASQAHQLLAVAVAQLRRAQSAAQDVLSGVLSARLMQVHVWLSDMQGSSAGSSAAAGLSEILTPAELQTAAAAWVQLQQGSSSSSSTHSASIAAALGHLLLSDQQQSRAPAVGSSSSSSSQDSALKPQQQVVTADGLLVADVHAVLRGVPVAVIVLDDAEVGPLQRLGAAAAAESLAAAWVPGHSKPASSSNINSQQLPSQQQQQQGVRLGAPSSSSSASLLAALSKQRFGDAMWRAKALANRGFWVEVVSSRDWVLLDGRLDAQVEYLRERLWPLLTQAEGLEGAAAGQLQGVVAAQPQAV